MTAGPRIAIAAMVTLVVSVGATDAKPNFSGEWKLDEGKSKLGPLPRSYSLTRKITHADPRLEVADSQQGGPGEQTSTQEYTTDRKVSTNTFMNNPVESTAVWDGNSLVITMKADVQGFAFQRIDRWTLSADGKTLTSVVAVHGGDGDFEFTFVMNRVERDPVR